MSSSASVTDPDVDPESSDNTSTHVNVESLSHLLVQVCSVRLPSSCKLVDLGVIMRIDDKYTYRTEIIRKKGKTSSLIHIDESFDVLVSINSVIHFQILAPTRIFGSHDLGQLRFNLKSVIENYCLNHQNNDETSPSYRIQLSFENSTTITNPFRSNIQNSPTTGMIEVIFYGSILKQQIQTTSTRNVQAEAIRPSIDENQLEQLKAQVMISPKHISICFQRYTFKI